MEGAWNIPKGSLLNSLGSCRRRRGCDYHFLSGVGVGNLGTIVLSGAEATVRAGPELGDVLRSLPTPSDIPPSPFRPLLVLAGAG